MARDKRLEARFGLLASYGMIGLGRNPLIYDGPIGFYYGLIGLVYG